MEISLSAAICYSEATPECLSVDVTKSFGISDAWDFEQVEKTVKLIRRELSAPRRMFMNACVQAFSVKTGEAVATIHMRDPKKVDKEYKEFLGKVKSEFKNRIGAE